MLLYIYSIYCISCIIQTCTVRLTLSHYASQSTLELVLGLLHLLLMLTLLACQAADVSVGRLDHGVEVVGVPAVDFAPFQPGEEDAHCFGKLAVVWQRTEDAKKERVSSVQINYSCRVPGQYEWGKKWMKCQKRSRLVIRYIHHQYETRLNIL